MRGVSEPYRMFTSRAEYRLRLRADNADQRLTPLGIALGCVGLERAAAFRAKAQALADGRARLDALSLTPTEAARYGLDIVRDGRRRSAFELLAHPGVTLERLAAIWPEIGAVPPKVAAQLEVDARYAAYLERQAEDIAMLERDEALRIPDGFDYAGVASLSTEVRQKLARHRPATLAHAGRIDGITPAALMAVLAHLRKTKVA
jgi:tRNA uridine 5-carboxymethylaminomethyl modification enzyme